MIGKELMMEEAHAAEDHGHAIFVGGLDDVFVAQRAARLKNIFHAALAGPVDAVSEREECVGTKGDAIQFGEPVTFFPGRQLIRNTCEKFGPTPFFIGGHIFAQELVDGIISVRTLDPGLER